jgi:hypothetical protein
VFYEHSPSFTSAQLQLLNQFIDQHLKLTHVDKFDYVFVSLFSYLAQKFGEIFLPQLRTYSSAKIVVGGAGLVFVKSHQGQLAFAEEFKASGVIDEFITGEAEESIPMYLAHGQGAGIGNGSFKQIDNLDTQPWPDYTYYNLDNYSSDNQQELVIIGIDMDKEAIINKLESALLTEDELALGEKAWLEFKDPFPVWGEMEEAVAV